MKLTDHTYACNTFQKFSIWSACNDRKRKLCKSTETKKFVKSYQVNLFLAGFSYFETTVRWLHLEAKKLDPSRSHDFPHQWFAIDSLNHRRSNIILFGKTTELIALQNSLSRVSIYYSVRIQTSDQRAKGKNVTFSCSEQTRPKYLENYNIIVAFCQDLVQGLICFLFYA